MGSAIAFGSVKGIHHDKKVANHCTNNN